MMNIENKMDKLLNDMTNILQLMSSSTGNDNLIKKSDSRHESCIKIKDLNLAPLIIDADLKEEIKIYRERAIIKEQELKKKRTQKPQNYLLQSKSHNSNFNATSDSNLNKRSISLNNLGSTYTKLDSLYENDCKIHPVNKYIDSEDNTQFDNSDSSDLSQYFVKSESKISTNQHTENKSLGFNMGTAVAATGVTTSSSSIDSGEAAKSQRSDDELKKPRIPLERKSSFTVEKPSPLLKNFHDKRILNGQTSLDNNLSEFMDIKTIINASNNPELKKYYEYLEKMKEDTISQQKKQILALGQQYTKQFEDLEKMIIEQQKKAFNQAVGGAHSVPTYAFGDRLKEIHKTQNFNEKDPVCTVYFKLAAMIRGYFTRRLMKTDRVKSLIDVIKDTTQFALKFQNESPIKSGYASSTDIELIDRIISQLQSALFEIHRIFFEMSFQEHVHLIEQDRLLKEKIKKRALKEKIQQSLGSSSTSTIKTARSGNSRRLSSNDDDISLSSTNKTLAKSAISASNLSSLPTSQPGNVRHVANLKRQSSISTKPVSQPQSVPVAQKTSATSTITQRKVISKDVINKASNGAIGTQPKPQTPFTLNHPTNNLDRKIAQKELIIKPKQTEISPKTRTTKFTK